MERIPERVPGVNVASLQLPAREQQLLGFVDGTATVDDIAAAGGVPVEQLNTWLDGLAKAGVVRFADGGKTVVARMGVQKLKLGEMLQGQSVDDPDPHVEKAKAALARGDLASAREAYNLAWMADPTAPEVTQLKRALDQATPAAAPVTPKAAAPAGPASLSIADGSICKNPKSRTLVINAGKKASAGDHAGAFRDVQMALAMEAGNARLIQFRDDLETLRKPS